MRKTEGLSGHDPSSDPQGTAPETPCSHSFDERVDANDAANGVCVLCLYARTDALRQEVEQVTRERDKAVSALRIVQSAAKTIVAGSDRRVLEATKHEPAARAAIATLESERDMNAILTGEVDKLQNLVAALTRTTEGTEP